jgi:hypothetical protein
MKKDTDAKKKPKEKAKEKTQDKRQEKLVRNITSEEMLADLRDEKQRPQLLRLIKNLLED